MKECFQNLQWKNYLGSIIKIQNLYTEWRSLNNPKGRHYWIREATNNALTNLAIGYCILIREMKNLEVAIAPVFAGYGQQCYMFLHLIIFKM